jgi:hypothetical protein
MILFPNNIFTRLIQKNCDEILGTSLLYHPAALIAGELKKNTSAVGLMPIADIIQNKEIFISKKFGLSFEGALSNSYIYYKPMEETIREISLAGDISSTEVILIKIFFKELYNSNVEVIVSTNDKNVFDKHSLIIGDKNFEAEIFNKGISFAEQIMEEMNLPFVNYVLASFNEENLKDISEKLLPAANAVYDTIDKGELDGYSNETKEFFKSNASSLIMEFDEMDIEGINHLLRLPYFHGIIKDLIEIKFV